ncbi:MAG: type II toxin-antitoxin system VapC family toxin [Solirubrobacterales bacterium]
MKKRVYIETSFVSYLAAKPTRNLLATAWQEIATTWWETRGPQFDLYTSELTVAEAARGDKAAAQRRLEYLKQLPVLNVTDSSVALAQHFLQAGAMPAHAFGDALHVALAVVHHMDYLLTWNCRHIDNAETKPLVRNVCLMQGLSFPEICTPQELMGESNDER